jgi:hypothetical protein
MTKRRSALAFVAVAFLTLGLAARVPATPPVHGLQLRVVTGMAERLVVAPVGAIVRADALQPPPHANAALGRVLLANKTRRPVMLEVRALPSAHDLDDDLRVSVTVAGRTLTRTTLGGLRDFTAPVRLPSGLPMDLAVRVWLPADTPESVYVGRTLDVVLELRTEPVIEG